MDMYLKRYALFLSHLDERLRCFCQGKIKLKERTDDAQRLSSGHLPEICSLGHTAVKICRNIAGCRVGPLLGKAFGIGKPGTDVENHVRIFTDTESFAKQWANSAASNIPANLYGGV